MKTFIQKYITLLITIVLSCKVFEYYRDVPPGTSSNSFRMHFNPELKILSIHYYDSPYSHMDCAAFNQLQRNIDCNIIGNYPITDGNRNVVYLKRNPRSKSKNILIKQKITHKMVLFNKMIDGRIEWMEDCI